MNQEATTAANTIAAAVIALTFPAANYGGILRVLDTQGANSGSTVTVVANVMGTIREALGAALAGRPADSDVDTVDVTVQFTGASISVILTTLSFLPFREVAGLINAIQQQADPQIRAAQQAAQPQVPTAPVEEATPVATVVEDVKEEAAAPTLTLV